MKKKMEKKKWGQVLNFALACFGSKLIVQNSRPDPVASIR